MEKNKENNIVSMFVRKVFGKNRNVNGKIKMKVASDIYSDEEWDKTYDELNDIWHKSAGYLDFVDNADKEGYGVITIKKFLSEKLGSVPKEIEKFWAGDLFSKKSKVTIAGYKERKRRDRTGPYKDSYQRKYYEIGKRKQKGNPYPYSKKGSKLRTIISNFIKKAPFKSPQQEAYLWMYHPEIAEKWYKEHGHAKGFREYMKKKRRKKKSK